MKPLYIIRSKAFKATNGFTVRFYVYKNSEDLRKANHVEEEKKGYTTEGLFHCGKYTKNSKIHLSMPMMGAGYVAHEIQHFICYWIACNGLDIIGKHFEKIAWVTGEITSEYWKWFYKNFTKEKK